MKESHSSISLYHRAETPHLDWLPLPLAVFLLMTEIISYSPIHPPSQQKGSILYMWYQALSTL